MRLVWVFFAAVLGAISTPASAVTVANIADNAAAWGGVDASATLAVPGVWTQAPQQGAGHVVGVSRSPFDPSDTGAGGIANWGQIAFWYVGPNDGPAILSFGSDQNRFGLLWGSVDDYNFLDFYDDGGLVASVTSAEIAPLTATAQRGASLVSISDLVFDEVRFRSTSPAFEFSNITAGYDQVAPIPLPPAILMFLSALAGAAFVARRRRAAG